MNIAFWFLIILALILLWFSLAPRFKSIGSDFVDMVEDVKKAVSNENTNEDKEQ